VSVKKTQGVSIDTNEFLDISKSNGMRLNAVTKTGHKRKKEEGEKLENAVKADHMAWCTIVEEFKTEHRTRLYKIFAKESFAV
jgi:hypothetical protein